MSLKKCKSTQVPPFTCPVSFNKQNDTINSKINNKDDNDVCQHCQHRLRIICQLKELCKELNLLDKPADDSVPDIHKNYSKWADKFLPLITYPIYRVDRDIHDTLIKLDSFPTWKLPRFPSQELVASKMNKMCDCKKRNGLQDYCARNLCQGSLQCLKKPYPLCVPSGAWKKNVNPTEAKNIMDWLDSLDGEEQKNCACSDNADLCTCEPDFKFKDERSVRRTKSKDRKSKDRSNDGDESDSVSQTLQLRKSTKKKESSTKISGSKSSIAGEETKKESRSRTNAKSATTINTVSDRTATKLASERSFPLGDINKSIRAKVTNPKCLSIQPNLEKNETACNA